jgi:hypothetical protein
VKKPKVNKSQRVVMSEAEQARQIKMLEEKLNAFNSTQERLAEVRKAPSSAPTHGLSESDSSSGSESDESGSSSD